MSKNQLPDTLMQGINASIRQTRREIAKHIANDFQKEYSTVIWKFYHHYTPRMYNRTYETLLASNFYRSGRDYRKITTWGENEITICFQVGSDYMDDVYDDATDWVFSRTFEEGIHGWRPLSVKGILAGKNEAVGWRLKVKQPKKPLNPSPKARMDKWFEKYQTPANLDKICKPILENNIKKHLRNN